MYNGCAKGRATDGYHKICIKMALLCLCVGLAKDSTHTEFKDHIKKKQHMHTHVHVD